MCMYMYMYIYHTYLILGNEITEFEEYNGLKFSAAKGNRTNQSDHLCSHQCAALLLSNNVIWLLILFVRSRECKRVRIQFCIAI